MRCEYIRSSLKIIYFLSWRRKPMVKLLHLVQHMSTCSEYTVLPNAHAAYCTNCISLAI